MVTPEDAQRGRETRRERLCGAGVGRSSSPSGYEGFVESSRQVGVGVARLEDRQSRIDAMGRQCDVAWVVLVFYFASLIVLFFLCNVLAG